ATHRPESRFLARFRARKLPRTPAAACSSADSENKKTGRERTPRRVRACESTSHSNQIPEAIPAKCTCRPQDASILFREAYGGLAPVRSQPGARYRPCGYVPGDDPDVRDVRI